MVNNDNIVFNVKEDDAHSIVYLHHGKVIVAVGSDKYDAIEKLNAQIAIEESREDNDTYRR
jgi:hypothetical protein